MIGRLAGVTALQIAPTRSSGYIVGMSQQNSGVFQVRTQFGSSGGLGTPQPLSEHEQQQKALAVARAFEPKRVVGFNKTRIGRDFDGGYIHVDDFSGVGAALSFGVSDDASWDVAIASKSIPVHQFDHTIEKGPVPHPLIQFYKQRIAPTDGPGDVCLDTLVGRLLADCKRAVLKIDIEGDEWQVFSAVSPRALMKFSQITCEFHGLQLAAEPVWSARFIHVLRKLRAVFEIVHVHGNNALPFVNVGNVVLPSLLEVTFANRDYYQFAETNEVFPTALDQPNLPDRPDLWLGCFKF
jgi:hypothetical protein